MIDLPKSPWAMSPNHLASGAWPEHPNVYYRQEDYVRDKQQTASWGLTVFRPTVIYGDAPGANKIPFFRSLYRCKQFDARCLVARVGRQLLYEQPLDVAQFASRSQSVRRQQVRVS